MFAFLLYLTTLLIILKTYSLEQIVFYLLTGLLKITTFLAGFITMSAAALGAFTSKYGASLSCNNWPGCTDSFFPNFTDMFQVIHFSHRVIAMLLVLILIKFICCLEKVF